MLMPEVVHDALRQAGEGVHEVAHHALERVVLDRGRAVAQFGLEVAVEPLVGVELRRIRRQVSQALLPSQSRTLAERCAGRLSTMRNTLASAVPCTSAAMKSMKRSALTAPSCSAKRSWPWLLTAGYMLTWDPTDHTFFALYIIYHLPIIPAFILQAIQNS